MDKVAQGTEIALPFRIMPSRARNYKLAYSALITGAAVLAGGILWGDSAVAQTTLALSSLLAFGFGFYFYQRERRYFAPRARYWMTISPQSLTIVTPDGEATYRWSELAPFMVTRKVNKKVGDHYTLTAKGIGDDGRELWIDLDDFATKLHDEDDRRAEAMGTTLNHLRNFCLSEGAQAGALYTVPQGLVVAPMPEASGSATPEAARSESSEPILKRAKSRQQLVERQ